MEAEQPAAKRPGRRARLLAIGFLGPLALALLGSSLYQAGNTTRVLLANERAVGRVVEVAEHRTAKSLAYAPVLEYEHRGQTRRGRPNGLDRSPDKHRVGDTVSLHVDPSDPERVYRDSFGDRWAPAAATLLIGAVVATFLLLFLRSSRKES